MPGQSQGGFFSRNPFMAGMAGGLAGGMLGGMLFGGTGHASAGGSSGGGGMGLLDFAIIGLLLYFGWRFFKRRRIAAQSYAAGGYSNEYSTQSFTTPSPISYAPTGAPTGEVEEGFRRLSLVDPGLSEEALKETFQDLFFRIQAAWMNRSLDGVQGMLTSEMAGYFAGEFEEMKRQGRINRLENIAIRKVEPSEIWQEAGTDFVTVLITANLLDYTVDDKTGDIVGGDKLNPVKFQEFWTFSRDSVSSDWRLSAINQPDEALGRAN